MPNVSFFSEKQVVMAASATNVTCKTLAFGSASSVTEASAAPARPAAVFVMKAVPAVAGICRIMELGISDIFL